MGNTNHYERIRQALETLKSELGRFVETHLKEAYPNGWRSKYAVPDWVDGDFNADVQVLANTVINNWDDVFGRVLKGDARHLVHQVRKTRNRFAHQEPFDTSDAYTALHEIQRLLEAFGSGAAASIQQSKNELATDIAGAGESPEDAARMAEAAADDALARGASEPGPTARLLVVRKGQPTEEEYVFATPAVIGRADATTSEVDVDLTSHEDGVYVSRRHAQIVHEDGAFHVEDLGSSNGTFVRRTEYERVERSELADGDEVAFGNAKFVFRTEG